jgi:hypothetical protein
MCDSLTVCGVSLYAKPSFKVVAKREHRPAISSENQSGAAISHAEMPAADVPMRLISDAD